VSLVSYAQNFEDVVLWRALGDVEAGRYLDIGAQDPEIDSVSFAFYEAGWRGIHVEPVPFYAARLRDARPDEIVIEAAVTDAPGPIGFFEIPETGLSTSSKEIAEKHNSAGFASRQITVPCIRLDGLLELGGDEFQWMKIDVEGMEPDVLRSWGESPRRPWIIIVESTFPSTQEPTHQAWIDEVLSRGYQEVFFDGLSRYFLHQTHAERSSRFAAPANVFDRFSVALHHFSAAGARSQLETSGQQLDEERARAERLHAQLNDARIARDAARKEQSRAADRLLQAEQDHRQAIETLMRERSDAERRSNEVEQQLRRDLLDRDNRLAVARVELARLEERSAQLQDKLERADALTRQADARLEASEQRIAQITAVLEETRVSSNQQILQARSHTDQARAETAQLRGHADRIEATLARADALIKSAAAERPDRWERMGAALGLTRGRRAILALASWDEASTPKSSPRPADSNALKGEMDSIMISAAPYHGRNPYHRANSLFELLSWHDVDFVRCAFVTMLGRQPDVEGEAYYTSRIRNGYSKMHMLWQLRRSSEGQRHDPGIAGLDRAIRRSKLGREPLIGPVMRLFTGTESDSYAARRWRSLANDVGYLREVQERNFARLTGHIESMKSFSRGMSASPSSMLERTPTAPLSDRAKDIFVALANVR
jgi:FkbM family methyltransferase